MTVSAMSTSYTADSNLRFRVIGDEAEVLLLLDTLPSGIISQSGAHWETSAETFSDPLGLLESTNVLRLELDGILSPQLDELLAAVRRERGNQLNYTQAHIMSALRKLKHWGKIMPSDISITGAHGELVLLYELLLNCDGCADEMAAILAAWDGFLGSTFDFQVFSAIVDQKTTTHHAQRCHRFSSPHQANPPNGALAWIASMGLKREQSTHSDARTLNQRTEAVRALLACGNAHNDYASDAHAELVEIFDSLIDESQVLSAPQAEISYRINPNLPLAFFQYSEIPGIESIRQCYDGIGWVESPVFCLDAATQTPIATIFRALINGSEEE